MKKTLFLFLFSTHFLSLGMHQHFDKLPEYYAIVQAPGKSGTWYTNPQPTE